MRGSRPHAYAALAILVGAIACPKPGVPIESPRESAGILSYDQIARVHIKLPAPAPDSFAADAARIASLPPIPSSRSAFVAMELVHALGMNPLTAVAVAPAAIAANAAVKASQAQVMEVGQEYLNAGTITHASFYRDWTRTEVPALQSVAIVRPDLGEEYFLDLAKHTFREKRTALPAEKNEETYVVSAADDVVVTLQKAAVASPLGMLTIGGHTTRGYRTDTAFTLSSALGWCSAGRHALTEIEYVADVVDPQNPAAPVPEGSPFVREACLPNSGASHREPGHLVLFRSTTFTGGAASGDFVNVFERGNLHVDVQSADGVATFTVPANFTRVE